MILIALITGALLPVYLFVLLGTGAITLTLLNCVGVILISLLSLSVVVGIATLSTYKGGK
jgi:hypothetical protein